MAKRFFWIKTFFIIGILCNLVLNIVALYFVTISQHYPIEFLSNNDIAKYIWITDYLFTAIALIVILIHYGRIDKNVKKQIDCYKLMFDCSTLLLLTLIMTVTFHVVSENIIVSDVMRFGGAFISIFFMLFIVARRYMEIEYAKIGHNESKKIQDSDRLGLFGYIWIFMFVILNTRNIVSTNSPILLNLHYSIIMVIWFSQLHLILRMAYKSKVSIFLVSFVFLFQLSLVMFYFINHSHYYLLFVFVTLTFLSIFFRAKIHYNSSVTKAGIGLWIPYLFSLFLIVQFVRPIFINGTLSDGSSWYFQTNHESFVRLFSFYTLSLSIYLISNLVVSDILLNRFGRDTINNELNNLS